MYNNGSQAALTDYAEAMKWYSKSADQGQASAQVNLGLMYAEGEGVPQNEAEAAKWYRRAAEQGNASGQSNLGVMYRNGKGVPQDPVRAYMWLSLSAAQGSQFAIKNRDLVAGGMTPAQIAEAQKLASEWKPTK
jgi:TPR repeat protein